MDRISSLFICHCEPFFNLKKLETSKPLRLQPARPPPAQAQAQPLETQAQLMPRPPNKPLPPPER